MLLTWQNVEIVIHIIGVFIIVQREGNVNMSERNKCRLYVNFDGKAYLVKGWIEVWDGGKLLYAKRTK